MTTAAVPDRDIVIYQGATFIDEFAWIVEGIPQSLVDRSAVMSVATEGATEPTFSISSTDGEIAFEPDGKRAVIKVMVPYTKTALLTKTRSTRRGAPDAVYDLVVIDDTSKSRVVFRVAQGNVALIPGVTQV